MLLALAAFFIWRFVRPLNIFVISETFERPIDSRIAPPPLQTLHAAECGTCHQEFYEEWHSTMHRQAWVDPYFQADWKFEGAPPICRNCHTPLDRQQPQTVLGFRDGDKWDPILAKNSDFDPALQHEGVTCTACHLRAGKILGPYGTRAPHAVEKLTDSNQVCVRCHVVEGQDWDSFLKFSACGTVAEIQATHQGIGATDSGRAYARRGPSGELAVPNVRALGCVECHMPAVERPLVEGGPIRRTRRHLWRGGHHPPSVRAALDIKLDVVPADTTRARSVQLTLTNTGAAHFLPTGIPDRHLSVTFSAYDIDGQLIDERRHLLKRTILWRPFLIDLRDTRLQRWQPRAYQYSLPTRPRPAAVDVVVRYHLLDESRRARINYQASDPIAYEIFRQRAEIDGPGKSADRSTTLTP